MANCKYSEFCEHFNRDNNLCVIDYERCRIYNFRVETDIIDREVRNRKGLDDLADTPDREGEPL